MAKVKQDEYANIAHIRITESAANTLTFQELSTGIATFEKVAFKVVRIEYSPYPASVNLLAASADILDIALTTSDQVSNLLKDKPQIVDKLRLGCYLQGAGTQVSPIKLPIVHDFTDMPGGGLIMPSSHIYGAIQGTSLGSAATADLTIYFTYLSLDPADYWELVEATRALT